MTNKVTVFSYTKAREGEYGIRQRISTPKENDLSPDLFLILASNLSDEESLNLISQTPEICWIMGAIEGASNQKGEVNPNSLASSLSNAIFAVLLNRRQRQDHSLQIASDIDYVEFHEYRAFGITKENRLIAAVLDAYKNGLLDLDQMALSFDQILNS